MTSWLVVNADDLGVSRGATLGIVKAHQEGIVTSASLAATTPFYDHAVETCVASCPDLGIGLHFTLTSGRPVSPLNRVPDLVDNRGFFRWRFMSLLVEASLRKNPKVLEQVGIELEAQIQRLVASGVRPDHIDSERHVHLIPGIFEQVVRAAQRHRMPFLRLGSDIGGMFIKLADMPGLVLHGGFAKTGLLSGLSSRDRRLLDGSVRTADRFASYMYSGKIDLVIGKILNSPPLSGITEIMVHPGIPEESLGIDLGNRTLERYLASQDRRTEMEACIRSNVSTGSWTLTNYKRLARS